MDRKLEQVQGMTFEEFNEAVLGQQKTLPMDRTVATSNQRIAERLGGLLLAAEDHRIKGTKKIPLWPLEWKEIPALGRRCTGRLMTLGRVCAQTKTMTDGSVTENKNYGRFFVFTKDPVKDENGNYLMRKFIGSSGKEFETTQTAMTCFQWFDETMYVRSGALAWACAKRPELSHLMTTWGMTTWGIKNVHELWPEWLMSDMYTDGLTVDEVLIRWGAKSPKRSREGGQEQEEEEEEEGGADPDEETTVADEPSPPPAPTKKRRAPKWRRASDFIDDEAAEAD